jgi:hypothetical protein
LRGYRSHDGRVWRSADFATSPAKRVPPLLRGSNSLRGLLESFDFLVLQQL